MADYKKRLNALEEKVSTRPINFTPEQAAAAALTYAAAIGENVDPEALAAAEALLAHMPPPVVIDLPAHLMIDPTDDARTAAEKYAATLDWNPQR